ncbi:twitching motility protein PilT [Smithella sp. SCADC]|jgi:predicted nucleic acid-binding protein|nr:twitching motility protein PilT [Smithella sp. SCADC]HAR50044.1 PIN domain-containing protein [Smithella sp.]
MKDRIFVDTNILVYAHDLSAGDRHTRAFAVIESLWEEQTGVISTQVLQEFYVTVTRKIKNPLKPAEAREIIRNYLAWPVQNNDPETTIRASEIEETNFISFWDALIVVAALRLQAKKIISEDLNNGQIIEGILIENPLL